MSLPASSQLKYTLEKEKKNPATITVVGRNSPQQPVCCVQSFPFLAIPNFWDIFSLSGMGAVQCRLVFH